MPETTYYLEYYADEKGKEPFRDWLYGLRDRAAFARITVRLDRVELGNCGFCKSVGNGVFELKIDYGPGIAFTTPSAARPLSCCSLVVTSQPRPRILKRQNRTGPATGRKYHERNDAL
jgi:putative component of toxin-antitoxin plasmid stabilization module